MMKTPTHPLRSIALLLPLLLGACAMSTTTGDRAAAATCSGPILDVSIAGDGYSIAGESFAAGELDRKLAALNRTCPIHEVRLHPGDRSIRISDTLAVGIAAKAIGARALYERDGELKGIEFVD
jgi:hypothetical protein